MNIPGPCCVCGATNYSLSCGGPTICPKCDCGHFDAATVMQQAKAMERQKEKFEGFLATIRSFRLAYLEDDGSPSAAAQIAIANKVNSTIDLILAVAPPELKNATQLIHEDNA